MVNIIAPMFSIASDPADIVAFNFQNTASITADSSYVTLGQVFASGAINPGQSLAATINGHELAVQVDAKTFYKDGSIQMAVLTLQQPTMLASSTAMGMLHIASSAASPPDVNVMATLQSHSLQVDLNTSDGQTYTVDVVSQLANAVASGTLSKWLEGSQVTQVSFSVPVSGSLRLAVTISAYADGTYSTQLGFNNDIALSGIGGPITYSASVFQDGTQILNQPFIEQYQYQTWSTLVNSNGSVPNQINIQHDPAYLEQIGAIPNFDLSNGVAVGVIDNEAATMRSPDWGAPLAVNGVTTYFPTTGGRGDIGPTTQSNAAWLISQNPTAALFALGQANTAGAIPWNYWVPATQSYLNTLNASNIWTDLRGGPATYTTGLTQQVDQTGSGWTLDTSHQPDLSYYAFLLTGRQQYLSTLNAQASFAISDTWPGYRGPAGELVVGDEQVRAQAWSLREIDEASYANPTGSAAKNYFSEIANANWKALVADIPAWTALQGQAYGQVEGYYGDGSGTRMPPWMQDYFASTAIQAAEHGNQDALTFLKWESNFLVGRFLQGANGFSPGDGITYNLVVGNASGSRFGTWAQIETATLSAGNSNGNGWAQSQGDYGELALQTLSGIISLTSSPDAVKAYNYLKTSGAPFIDPATRASDVQFDIIPVLAAGLTFNIDGTIASIGSPAPDPVVPAPVVPDPVVPAPVIPDPVIPDPVVPAPVVPDPVVPAPVVPAPVVPDPVVPAPVVPDPVIPAPVVPAPVVPAPVVTPLIIPDLVVPAPVIPDPVVPAPVASTPVTPRSISDFQPLGTTTLTITPPLNQPPPSGINAVYRFFDTATGTQFLTTLQSERDNIIATRTDLKYEGVGMGSVSADPADVNVATVFRFFDINNGSHFFTTSVSERNEIIESRPDLRVEQSNLFEHSREQAGDIPVYRFFDGANGGHFFTSNPGEKADLLLGRTDMIYEGVAFYAPKL